MKPRKLYHAFVSLDDHIEYLNAAGRWTKNSANKKTFKTLRGIKNFAANNGEDIMASYGSEEVK